MKSKKINKILGIGLSAGLVFGLIGAVFAAPVSADLMKWGLVNTPSWEDYEILPDSDILDYAIDGDDGNTVYAVTGVSSSGGILASGGTGGAAALSDTQVLCDANSVELAGGTELNTSYGQVWYPFNLPLADITDVSFSWYPSSATQEDFSAWPVYKEEGQDYSDNTGYISPYVTLEIYDGVNTHWVISQPFARDPDGSWSIQWETWDITDNAAEYPPASGMNPTQALWHDESFTDDAGTGGAGAYPAGWEYLSYFQNTLYPGYNVVKFKISMGWWAFTTNQSAYVDCISLNGVSLSQEPRLFKSEDDGFTWTDITAKVQGAANLPEEFISLTHVSVAQDDVDWLAVAGYMADGTPAVVASKDGGSNFSYTGDLVDGTVAMQYIYDLAVSIEVDSVHNIALAGMSDTGTPGVGTVFRLEAGTWLGGAWKDTADYNGWDDGVTGNTEGVVAIAFSPNFDLDDTIVIIGVNGVGSGVAYLQTGIWESGSGAWNDIGGFPNAVAITSDGDTLLTGVYQRSCGLALPDDYDGTDSGARVVYLYVNAYNTTTNLVGGYLFRVDNASLSTQVAPAGDPLLASIDVHGDADTGKMMIGEYMRWDNDAGDPGDPVMFNCCEGVRVWHTEELDICCPQWEGACKDPSGPYMALVTYTPDGEKAHASTSGALDMEFPGFGYFGGLCDESAFSISLDDGVSFNQVGLIDTDIDDLADVAVCPDCSTIYLATVNYLNENQVCQCDSLWRTYDDGDTWERIYHGDWYDGNMTGAGWPMLRLPCDAIEDCCDQDLVAPSGTVYLGLYDTKDIFYSRDCGQCWNDPPATKIYIEDFAVESENIVYVINDDGDFSMSTQYGRRWSDAVDTGLDSGHQIVACCDEGFIVVGPAANDKVAWSDDGGDNWNLTDALPSAATGAIHVACDPVCENIIYAAADGSGIYRTDLTDGSWTDINALPVDYTGIVVAREGTLYASTDELLVSDGLSDTPLFTDCFGRQFISAADYESGDNAYSGVARNLDPCETACCGTEDWDYLFCGLGPDSGNPSDPWYPAEDFDTWPGGALKICGCLSVATNSVLWAIDSDPYDVTDGAGNNDGYGGLWSYEDCAAKLGPTLTSPADGSVLDCEPCAGCDAANFTLKWERMCEACSYDIQIMDENGNVIAEWVDQDITGDPPSLFVDGTLDSGYYYLECGMTYTWHVREANTSCECVHSPWSETWSFTIAPGAADAIDLLAPTKGALDVPINNIGFSWTSVRNASSYSFVLSPNANLTSALVSQDMSTTAFNYVGPLDYSKAYYWQVIAWEDGTRLTTSSIGVFNTMAEPVEPTPPVVVEQQPAPVINIPAAEKITPTWIYAIIGIGAALAVVVIVLIVRTRRP